MSTKLKPFRIGDVEIASPVILAALAGYSDLPFRRICRSLGAPYCATEMLLDRSMLVSGKLRRRLLTLSQDDRPIAGQLIGREPNEMAAAAKLLCDKGFDVVDLNFACPVRKAVRKGHGGAMMNDPDRAARIIAAVAAAIDRPLTLKMRMSFEQADRSHSAFMQIADAAVANSVAAICVHARSVEAGYFGPADWDFLKLIRQRYPELTIIGSGDVRRPEDALRMLEQTGVDSVAAARGALGNPWFFRQVADLAAGRDMYQPGVQEQRDVLCKHFDGARQLYGDERGPKVMRKHGIKYASLHPTPKKVRMAFVEVKRPDDWHDVVQRYYNGD